MTYSTPELLLVGAAQNLVLGLSPVNTSADCKEQFEDIGYEDRLEW